MRSAVRLLATLLAAACGEAKGGHKPAPTETLVTAILSARCAPCHIGGADGAVPAALAIFDLTKPSPLSTVKPSQHDALLGRLSSAPAGERDAVRAFLRK